jgi:hypothetical protein
MSVKNTLQNYRMHSYQSYAALCKEYGLRQLNMTAKFIVVLTPETECKGSIDTMRVMELISSRTATQNLF